MARERAWSAWVGDLCVAKGDGGAPAALYYGRQYAEEGEVVIREGFTKRGRIAMRIGSKVPRTKGAPDA